MNDNSDFEFKTIAAEDLAPKRIVMQYKVSEPYFNNHTQQWEDGMRKIDEDEIESIVVKFLEDNFLDMDEVKQKELKDGISLIPEDKFTAFYKKLTTAQRICLTCLLTGDAEVAAPPHELCTKINFRISNRGRYITE